MEGRSAPSEPGRRLNVILLLTDDQRFDTVRALGNGQIVTPNIDALAAAGTAFDHAYIMGGTCPAVCMPSRAMLHCGRSLFHVDSCGQEIPAGHALLGAHLRSAGYHTHGIGKWHNARSAFARSFSGGDEIFFGGMMDHWNVPVYRFDPTGTYGARLPAVTDPALGNKVLFREADHVHAGRHSTDVVGDAAVRFLQDYDRNEPFFLYASFLAPHDPRNMPEGYRRLYRPEDIVLPPNCLPEHPFDNGELQIRDERLEAWPRTPANIRRHVAEYYAMISHLDAAIGRILSTLRCTPYADNTIVVLAGDNGLALGQHGLMGKQSVYEHSVRVPLLFQGPGIPRGERRDAFVYLFDVFPTLCELVGLHPPRGVDGASLVPTLRDPRVGVRETVYCAYRHLHRSVRERQFKLIEYVVDGRRTTQLFDLRNDPWEQHNLCAEAEHRRTVDRLRETLAEERDAYGDRREMEAAFWNGWTDG